MKQIKILVCLAVMILFTTSCLEKHHHKCEPATCEKPKRCITCGKIFGEKRYHSTQFGKCKYCGEEFNAEDWAIIKANCKKVTTAISETDPLSAEILAVYDQTPDENFFILERTKVRDTQWKNEALEAIEKLRSCIPYINAALEVSEKYDELKSVNVKLYVIIENISRFDTDFSDVCVSELKNGLIDVQYNSSSLALDLIYTENTNPSANTEE